MTGATGGAKRREFAVGWKIVLAALVGVGCGATSLPFYSLGSFIGPLEQAYGWSRGAIQAGMAFSTWGAVLMAPVIGWSIDRYGARPVALLSLVGLSIALWVVSLSNGSLTVYYTGWALIALLGAGTTPIAWTRAITGWFDASRGLALGITLMGSGLAAALLPRFVTGIVEADGVAAGYRALALLPLVLALPLALAFFRERPAAATSDSSTGQHAVVGATFREALASPRLWLIFGCFCLLSIAVAGLIPALVPILTDGGFARADAASVAALIGVAVIAGRLIVGWLLDRLWAPGVAAVTLALPTITCLILLGGTPSLPMAATAALLLGFAAGAEFDLIAYLVARYFGLANYGKVYALAYAGFAAGAGLGPMLFGALYDSQGGYRGVLLLSTGLFIAGSVPLVALGRYPTWSTATR